MPTFEQAGIPIENVEEFERLRGVFERLFSAGEIGTFLKAVNRKGLLIRDYEGVLVSGAMEKADPELRKSGKTARQMYEVLPISDQAQVREFYLVRLEKVDDATRRKFRDVYRLN